MLFTDGSVNTKSKIGFGAYLVVDDIDDSIDTLKKSVRTKKFENTSSTKLELQTMIWALNEIKDSCKKLIVYTDSQNIIGLKDRREKLEQNNYYSKNNKRLSNYELYQQFYSLTDILDCEFIKVKGHKSSKQKDSIDRIFTLVDKASRNAVRNSEN